jgi:YHS domain-containing protein
MKRLLFVCTLLSLSIVVLAEDKPAATKPATTQAAAPVNKKCPVSGDAIDPKGKTVLYKGQLIGFCCDNCIEPFNKDPEKYARNIK